MSNAVVGLGSFWRDNAVAYITQYEERVACERVAPAAASRCLRCHSCRPKFVYPILWWNELVAFDRMDPLVSDPAVAAVTNAVSAY